MVELKVGALYMLKGGHVMRYRGPWGGTGSCGAYQMPTEELSDPPVGYSASAEEVLRELTAADVPGLVERVAALRARGLDIEADEAVAAVLELQ